MEPGHHHTQEDKVGIARLSIISNTSLLLLKLIVGLLLGSVSLISEAIHSGMDLFASIIAFFSVRSSSQPPDDKHAFGHGKYEDFSGLIEAILIFMAAIIIIYEALLRFFEHGPSELDGNLLIAGIAVMGISAIVNTIISSRLMHIAKSTESIALESDAWHLRTDVYTSLGVLAGLVLIKLTGIVLLDSIVAIGVAIIIMKTAIELTLRSYRDLIDHRLNDSEEDRIRVIVCEHQSEYVSFHNLRTRRAGPQQFIEFHLVVDRNVTIEQAHDLTDHLENDLQIEFPRSTITIHVEPCTGDGTCTTCSPLCKIPLERRM